MADKPYQNLERSKKTPGGGACVKIPLPLLSQTIDLLENIDPRIIAGYDQSVIWDYEAVLAAFRKKKASIDLRQYYANIIFAEDEDKRFDARMRYLQEKRNVKDFP